MKVHILLLLALLSVMSFSCKKEVVQADDYFPNEVGYQWTYRWTNSNGVGAIMVKIVDSKPLPDGKEAKVWQYTYNNGSNIYFDTLWVVSTNNEVSIYNNSDLSDSSQMPYEKLHYIFPLENGRQWFGNLPQGDTTKVLNQKTVSVPAGTFDDVFRISKDIGFATNAWVNDTLYFKEYIGLVKFSQHEFQLGSVLGDGVWELTDYNF